jgi:glutamate dehydrogenase/leucine dehydrogenase
MRHIGPEIYVPAPDMGTNEADMGYIRDCISYSGGTAITRGCYVTGKPPLLGGIAGRRPATGKGVVCTVEAAGALAGLEIPRMTVCLQGFGNVGAVTAKDMYDKGAKIVAIEDLTGSIINPKGLNIEELLKHVETTGGVSGFTEAYSLTTAQFFETECDCFIPAAAGSQIDATRAQKMKTKMIAEGANAPTTPQADTILQDRGIFVIPDILCNAGGVFVSYLEYTQETQHEQKTDEEVERRLRERMTSCFNEVYSYARAHKQNMRCAAMDIALSKVVAGIEARGYLP